MVVVVVMRVRVLLRKPGLLRRRRETRRRRKKIRPGMRTLMRMRVPPLPNPWKKWRRPLRQGKGLKLEEEMVVLLPVLVLLL